MQYIRDNVDFFPGRIRTKGDILDIFPMYEEKAIRIEFFDDRVEKISYFDYLNIASFNPVDSVFIYPAKHYLVEEGDINPILKRIEQEMREREKFFQDNNLLVEAHRIKQRTMFDIEMIKETGYCKGIENYSRYFDRRRPGIPPMTLLDYLPENALIIIDESHVTIPQLRGMYKGDRSRKGTLIEFGFRLPSAYDNRPLNFIDFENYNFTIVYSSATPAEYEVRKSSDAVIELINRPTGIVYPEVIISKPEGQIDYIAKEIDGCIGRKERMLITTMTKRSAEDLCYFLLEKGFKVTYLHSEIDTLERIVILTNLRTGLIDALVGVNLLREGLDLPEVSRVIILDADKEGFLRSTRSLIQTFGRAARNVNSKVILFAERITDSMKRAVEETERRRKIQIQYNRKHRIEPVTVYSEIKKGFVLLKTAKEKKFSKIEDVDDYIRKLSKEMLRLASELKFEEAAELRDKIKKLKTDYIEIR
jgi:excinuclease ABC subunit B